MLSFWQAWHWTLDEVLSSSSKFPFGWRSTVPLFGVRYHFISAIVYLFQLFFVFSTALSLASFSTYMCRCSTNPGVALCLVSDVDDLLDVHHEDHVEAENAAVQRLVELVCTLCTFCPGFCPGVEKCEVNCLSWGSTCRFRKCCSEYSTGFPPAV